LTPSTRAQVVNTPPDCAARDFLEVARRFFADAGTAGLGSESAYILYYDAARNAVSAILAAAGRRVRGGTGAHHVAIAAAGDLLGKEHERTIAGLDAARSQRNQVSYDAWDVSGGDVEALREDAADCIAAAEDYVRTACS
jgi:hypothetical protein